jgi:predicted O-methyltransferase YrrM
MRGGPWRGISRRLPVLSAYERRITELTGEVGRLEGRVDELERAGEWQEPGHFYSAIPDWRELDRLFADAAGAPDDVPGVDLRIDEQWELFESLAPLYRSHPFSDHGTDGQRYRFVNDAYGHGDGLTLSAVLRHQRPARIVEVGSGWSSACILDTADAFLDPAPEVTFVEPHDELLRSRLLPGDHERVEILRQRVQDVELERFDALGSGDLLFIDSTHVAKLGSDVNHLFARVLPRLRSGVLIHVHDVFPGFEYPLDWHRERRVWTEDYLLRCFLQFNDAFEVVLWVPLLRALDRGRVAAVAPEIDRNVGGAIWLRRR